MAEERVVLIDDNEDLCEALASALQRRGWVVQIAKTAHAAFLAVAKHDPHAVLLDINLPDLDGFHVAQVLRAGLLRTGAVIVGFTGEDTRTMSARAIDAGINVLLTKPVRVATLCRHMETGVRF